MKVALGTLAAKAEEPAEINIEELLATRLLVQGNSGSGKSHLLRRLLEQSAPHCQQVIIDPEGDFVSLSDKFGHVVIDANRSPQELEAIAARVREHRVSAVLNLESLDVDMQMKAAGLFLNALFDAPREQWYPILVVVDEAQLFAPSASGEVSEEARKIALGAMTNLMCRGRKRGLAGVIATQRLAKLAKNVAAEASNFLMGRTFLDIDMIRASELLGMDRREAEKFRDLDRGSFIALGPALSRRPLPIRVGTVETKPRGATPKLSAAPEMSADDARDLILAPVVGARPERRPALPPAASVDEVIAQVEQGAAQAEAADQAQVEAGMTQQDRLTEHRRIAFEMMQDPEACYQSDAVLFQEFLTRVRIRRMGGPLPDLAAFKRAMIPARAGCDPDVLWGAGDGADPAWAMILKVAGDVAEDMRGVYFLFAKAAMDGGPCPSDATVARICGTRSSGRALSRVKGLEQAGFIVIRADMRGNRVVSIPDVARETAPGDPRGPDVDLAGAA